MIDQNGMPTSYQISINEWQRNRLIRGLLYAIAAHQYSKEQGTGDPSHGGLTESEHAEMCMFRDNLVGLPDQEKATPNVLHGLCL